MKRAINLNTKVTVKLNDIGLEYYRNYINNLIQNVPENVKSKFDFYQLKDNIFTSELWDIIHIFGSQIMLGKDTPFVDNCIHIEV